MFKTNTSLECEFHLATADTTGTVMSLWYALNIFNTEWKIFVFVTGNYGY